MKKLIVLLTLLISAHGSASTDYQCMSDCSGRYSWNYCKQRCEIREDQSPPRASSPAQSFIEGQRAQQESREIELQRMREELARKEQELAAKQATNSQVWDQVAKDFARSHIQQQTEEINRLKAENEALRKQIQELEKKNQ